ncbi:hypothetical protein IWQ60_007438 [Tieghemiomyces parasiticus]|uniref:SAM-dependent MTase RsmB/NOP-type domain-containing protein n=1 Tax=Tieghemiomyces parasiticus TaxID=78921 RepID=A0A9W8A2H0_9FUNG|nr:hypothetical protein IWQ60_007438 [Tieghemiomyces parasiticus]
MADPTAPSDIPEATPTLDLPASFLAFLRAHDLPTDLYDLCRRQYRPRRYYRTAAHLTAAQSASLSTAVASQLNATVTAVVGVPGFWSVEPLGNDDQDVRLSQTAGYQAGDLYGIDVTSGIAVLALEVQPGDHVLDLCCAPGAKLCMLADLIRPRGIGEGRSSSTGHDARNGGGTVTGVDVSEARLATCRSLVRKYRHDNVRLFAADGTTFDAPAPVPAPWRKPFHAPRLLRFENSQSATTLYDKVIVDAECTHDGSIAHIRKYDTWGWDKFEAQFMDPERLNGLAALQRTLLLNGWRQLKPGGILVYSTCSLTRAQNEDVLLWFLAHCPEASLEAVPHCATFDPRPLTDLRLQYAVRFNPIETRTSGFFVARLRKPC